MDGAMMGAGSLWLLLAYKVDVWSWEAKNFWFFSLVMLFQYCVGIKVLNNLSI
jgi:hypothetical protein